MNKPVQTPKFLSVRHLSAWLKVSPTGAAALEMAYPYRFQSLQEVERWLQNTTEGADLLSRFENARRKVLVVLYSDGWVEVYGKKDLDVHLVVKPHASSPEGGVLAERYLDATLPVRYAELYAPGMRRGFEKCRKVTARELLEARAEKNFWNTLKELGK